MLMMIYLYMPIAFVFSANNNLPCPCTCYFNSLPPTPRIVYNWVQLTLVVDVLIDRNNTQIKFGILFFMY